MRSYELWGAIRKKDSEIMVRSFRREEYDTCEYLMLRETFENELMTDFDVVKFELKEIGE